MVDETQSRELREILLSGEVDGIDLGGTAVENEVPTREFTVRFLPDYVPNMEVEKCDMVRDGAYTMVANQATSERAAPQPIGDEYQIYDGTLSDLPATAKSVTYGTRANWPADTVAYVNAIVLDHVVIGNEYQVFSVKDPLGAAIVTPLFSFTAVTGGQHIIRISPILGVGPTTFDIVSIVNEPDPSPAQWTGNWDYRTPNKHEDPAIDSGRANHSNETTGSILFSYEDSDGADRSTELLALTAGDLVTLQGTTWLIQQVTDNIGFVTFSVSPTVQHASDGVAEFTFDTVTATPITIGQDIDYWLGNANAEGLYIADGDYADIVPDDNAYGVGILLQDVSASTHWDPLAIGGDAAAGGASFTPIYDYVKLIDILDVADTYATVATLTTGDLPEGTYEMKFALMFTLATTNNSAFFQWRINNSDWTEILSEPKDVTDKKTVDYFYPIEHTGGPIVYEFQARKEGGAAQMDILFLDLIAQRVA